MTDENTTDNFNMISWVKLRVMVKLKSRTEFPVDFEEILFTFNWSE